MESCVDGNLKCEFLVKERLPSVSFEVVIFNYSCDFYKKFLERNMDSNPRVCKDCLIEKTRKLK